MSVSYYIQKVSACPDEVEHLRERRCTPSHLQGLFWTFWTSTNRLGID